MATKKLSVISILFLILALTACKDNKISRIPMSNFYDSCDTRFYFGQMITIGDPNEKFMVTLPYDWDIREQYSDTIYGIIAANFLSIPKEPQDQYSLTIFGYQTELEVMEYFENELLELLNDPNIQVEERGIAKGNPIDFPWVKFKKGISENEIFNLVLYAKAPEIPEVFILQGSVYDSIDKDLKLCYLKQLMNSFSLGID